MRYFGKLLPESKVVLAVVTILLVAAAAAAMQPGTWTAREDLPEERILTTTAEVNGIIYTIGGWADNQVFDTVYAFDPAGDHWTMKAPMPTPRAQAVAAVVDGKIYVIGGALDGDFTATGLVEVYDPATDTWVTRNLADHIDTPANPKSLPIDIGPHLMPKAVWSPAAAVVDGKIYITGGGTGDTLGAWNVYSAVQVYDPESNSWDTGTDMPTARCCHSVSVLDGLIYAAGGSSEDEIIGALEVYDPSTDTWTAAADMLTARDWLATAAVDGKVFAFGGWIWGDRVVHEVEFFDPGTGEWQLETRMPDPRWGQGIAVVDGMIYMVGGGPSMIDWQSNYVDSYDPNLYSYWTEAAAHLQGSFGSQWRTDICVANLNDEEANVELILHTDTVDHRKTYVIGPKEQKAFRDVVADMGIEGKGALEVRSDQHLRLGGRTYTDDGSGTFGQFIQFQPMDDGFFVGDKVWMVGLHQEEGMSRTNLIFANTGIREATVFVTLHRCSGAPLCTFVVDDLMPGKVDQRNDPFATECGEYDVGWGYARVMVVEGAGIRISASVIDSRTNDATTIVAER